MDNREFVSIYSRTFVFFERMALSGRKSEGQLLPDAEKCGILPIWETEKPKAALSFFLFGGFKVALQISCSMDNERKEGDTMMITYSDFIQTGIFIVALVNLCYQIFKGKK